MNKFIKKILKEADDYSDDFFQSKHVNKRREERNKQIKVKKKEALIKLKTGLKKIKVAYKSENWEDEREKLFLELFSKLHVDDKFYRDKNRYGYHLLDSNNIKRCFYDLERNTFWIDSRYIWGKLNVLQTQLTGRRTGTQSLINELLRKYFKLYDTRALYNLQRFL